MDILFGLAVLAAVGMAYYSHRQLEEVKALNRGIHSRDAVIRKLRSQLNAIEGENLKSKAVYTTISDIAFDVVVLLNEGCTILACNTAAKGLFGDRNPVGKKLDDVIHSPDLIHLVQYVLKEEGSLEEQFMIAAAHYRAKTQVVHVDGGRRFIGLAMQDITQLVNLNRSRRDLVANISHELRTPITRIRLIIEGLFLDDDRPKRKASIQSLKEIAMETDALLWLAQELLDLSMIESGQSIMKLVKTPLKQIVDDAIERLGSQAEMKDLTIVSHVAEKYDVLCDADQLRRVLANLIHNAVKWSPPREAITITANEQGDEIVISVFDNGPGVPDDLRERIFERFYQADVSHSGNEGTGLGLAICKHIIEAHGGRIRAEGNSHGKGGHFLFTVMKADTNFQDEALDADDNDSRIQVADSFHPFR